MFDSRDEHDGSVAGYDGGAVEAKRGAFDDGDRAATRCVAGPCPDNKNILQCHDRHPDEQSKTSRMEDGSSLRICLSLCPTRRQTAIGGRCRLWLWQRSVHRQRDRGPVLFDFVELHGGRCSPHVPQRPGWERLGSHEVVDDEVRTEDARHEKGFAEGCRQRRSSKET